MEGGNTEYQVPEAEIFGFRLPAVTASIYVDARRGQIFDDDTEDDSYD